jgi:hypothetical protein
MAGLASPQDEKNPFLDGHFTCFLPAGQLQHSLFSIDCGFSALVEGPALA